MQSLMRYSRMNTKSIFLLSALLRLFLFLLLRIPGSWSCIGKTTRFGILNTLATKFERNLYLLIDLTSSGWPSFASGFSLPSCDTNICIISFGSCCLGSLSLSRFLLRLTFIAILVHENMLRADLKNFLKSSNGQIIDSFLPHFLQLFILLAQVLSNHR